MLGALAVLIAFQLAGEAVRVAADLPVAGPVLGMGLLLAWLGLRGGPPPEALAATADRLLGNLPLLFVPAAVGVIVHGELLARQWPAMLGAVVGGALVTIAVTGAMTATVERMRALRRLPPPSRTRARRTAE